MRAGFTGRREAIVDLAFRIVEKRMGKTIAVFMLTTVMLAAVSVTEAQQPAKIPRIGFLSIRNSDVKIERAEFPDFTACCGKADLYCLRTLVIIIGIQGGGSI